MKITEYIKILIRKIQNILVIIGLFLIYLLGFGITLLSVIIFNRKLLRITKSKNMTFWKQAQGYEADIIKCLKQF